MPGTSPLPSGLNSWTGRMTSIPFVSRRRHRHRVDKSLPGRHSRPANAERECRPLPTRPACRHCRRQMPTLRARRRGVGIFDPQVGMSQQCSSRATAGSVTMAVACMILSSTWAGARPAAFLPFFRHARTCSTAVRLRFRGRLRADRRNRLRSPLVTPDQVRGDNGGTRTAGRRRCGELRVPIRPIRRKPPVHGPFARSAGIKPDSSGLVPGMTTREQAGRCVRQWKGAPASPAPPLPHCAKYGI